MSAARSAAWPSPTIAMASRCAWCDIDDADPDAYDPQPNILCETSPGRFQGIWLWRDVSPGDVAEQVSRNIWVKDGGDKGGWSVIIGLPRLARLTSWPSGIPAPA